jgi:hypothetical protein
MNKIDTCVYISPFLYLDKGSRVINWNGRDECGALVPPGVYMYYIWAFDSINPRVQATKQVHFQRMVYRTYLTHDTLGRPLSNPVLFSGGGVRNAKPEPVKQIHSKWIIGNDPEDDSLVETTASSGWCAVGGIAFQPDDPNFFFFDTLKESRLKITRKYLWVPNGQAVLDTGWGNNGEYAYAGAWPANANFGPGVVSDGRDYLFVVNADIYGEGKESRLIYLDVDNGAEIKRLDLSKWWVNLNDGKAGGQNVGGPTALFFRNDYLFLGSYSSCLNQMIDPYCENAADAVKWSNSNGDITGDHHFETGNAHPWVCNDYNSAPYKYNFCADNNLFSIFPAFDMGAVSFGLFAPDGTGMGYQALAGETANRKYGIDCIDYGSPYDGLYMMNYMGAYSFRDSTIWYSGQDSIKGIIASQVEAAESAPGSFSVPQNTPNPFNPSTTISFRLAVAGRTTVGIYNTLGQKVETLLSRNLSEGAHSVVWNARRYPSGVYFYTVTSGSYSKTMKMTLGK